MPLLIRESSWFALPPTTRSAQRAGHDRGAVGGEFRFTDGDERTLAHPFEQFAMLLHDQRAIGRATREADDGQRAWRQLAERHAIRRLGQAGAAPRPRHDEAHRPAPRLSCRQDVDGHGHRDLLAAGARPARAPGAADVIGERAEPLAHRLAQRAIAADFGGRQSAIAAHRKGAVAFQHAMLGLLLQAFLEEVEREAAHRQPRGPQCDLAGEPPWRPTRQQRLAMPVAE